MSDNTLRDTELANMVKMCQDAQESFKIALEMLDGMVKQAMEHGWSEDHARMLILLTMQGGKSGKSGKDGKS